MKIDFKNKAEAIIGCESGTYNLFIDFFYSLEKEDKLYFLKYLDRKMTHKDIEASIQWLWHNLPVPILPKGMEPDKFEPFLVREKILDDKEQELKKIKLEISELLKELEEKIERPNDIVISSNRETTSQPKKGNKKLSSIEVNPNITNKNEFIFELYNYLKKQNWIVCSKSEFEILFNGSAEQNKICWTDDFVTLVLLINELSVEDVNLLVDPSERIIISQHFLLFDSKEVLPGTLNHTLHRIRNRIRDNYHPKKERIITEFVKHLRSKYLHS